MERKQTNLNEGLEELQKRLSDLKNKAHVPPPLAAPFEEVLRQAEESSQARRELAEQELIARVLDRFSIGYAEYAAAFSTYSDHQDEDTRNHLAEKYQTFQKTMLEVNQNPPVVAFLRTTEFAQYFPEETSDDTLETVNTSSIDPATAKRFPLQQKLIEDFIAACDLGQSISTDELCKRYYPGVELKIAQNRIVYGISEVRKKLEAAGYTVTNTTSKGQNFKGISGVYFVTKKTEVDIENTKQRKDMPVRRLFLNAIHHLVTSENPDPEIVIELLERNNSEIQKTEGRSLLRALVALDRNIQKLYRRVDSGVATDNETKVHYLVEQHLLTHDLSLEEFRQKMKVLFGFEALDAKKLTTKESTNSYLDESVVEDVPFKRRDAVHLATVLSFYRDEIKFFCADCELPNRETIDNLFEKLGEALDQLEIENTLAGGPANNYVTESRLDAIQHYIEWRNQPNFPETSDQVSEFEFFQVIFNLQMIESKNIFINGEPYQGLEFLALLFTNPRVREFVILEINAQKEKYEPREATDTTEATLIDPEVIMITVPDQAFDVPPNVPEIETIKTPPANVDNRKVAEKANNKHEMLKADLVSIIDTLNNTKGLRENTGIAEITRLFPTLTQTVFDKAVKNGQIYANNHVKRDGKPVFGIEEIALLIYLESKKDKGGAHPIELKEARKIIRQLLQKD